MDAAITPAPTATVDSAAASAALVTWFFILLFAAAAAAAVWMCRRKYIPHLASRARAGTLSPFDRVALVVCCASSSPSSSYSSLGDGTLEDDVNAATNSAVDDALDAFDADLKTSNSDSVWDDLSIGSRVERPSGAVRGFGSRAAANLLSSPPPSIAVASNRSTTHLFSKPKISLGAFSPPTHPSPLPSPTNGVHAPRLAPPPPPPPPPADTASRVQRALHTVQQLHAHAHAQHALAPQSPPPPVAPLSARSLSRADPGDGL